MRPGIDVECREVGLRDGLQIQKVFFPTQDKIRWLTLEAAAGMPEIEVCSFVPPKLLPQFADNQEVVAAALKIDGLCVAALSPNMRGAQDAFQAGIHKLNYVTSVSESHNMSNVRRTVDESVADFERIVALRKETNRRLRELKEDLVSGGNGQLEQLEQRLGRVEGTAVQLAHDGDAQAVEPAVALGGGGEGAGPLVVDVEGDEVCGGWRDRSV